MLKKVVLLAGLLAVSQAQAEFLDNPKFRFGIGGASTTVEYDELGVDFKSTGWEAFVGYEFNRYLAVEAGYLDPGEDTIRSGSASATFSSKAIQASVLGSLPMTDSFNVYGRVGLLHWDAKASATDGFLSASASDDGDDPFFGIGVAATIEGALLRAEYRLSKIDDADLRSIGVSLAWRF